MFVNVYYNIIFARTPISTRVEGYLVHNHHKNPRLQTSNKLSNDVGKESISVITASLAKLEIFPFNAFWHIKELLEYLNFTNVVLH
jgi:hypothetical protein